MYSRTHRKTREATSPSTYLKHRSSSQTMKIWLILIAYTLTWQHWKATSPQCRHTPCKSVTGRPQRGQCRVPLPPCPLLPPPPPPAPPPAAESSPRDGSGWNSANSIMMFAQVSGRGRSSCADVLSRGTCGEDRTDHDERGQVRQVLIVPSAHGSTSHKLSNRDVSRSGHVQIVSSAEHSLAKRVPRLEPQKGGLNNSRVPLPRPSTCGRCRGAEDHSKRSQIWSGSADG